VRTPETYLGSERAAGFVPGPPVTGTNRYPGVELGELPQGGFALSGRWKVDGESATAAADGATLDARFTARKVFLVLSSRGGRPRDVEVSLDGEPIAAANAGEDVRGGAVTVTGERLYRLVSLPEAGSHRLRLTLPAGVTGYAFTFG
jgi:hypothetical protein